MLIPAGLLYCIFLCIIDLMKLKFTLSAVLLFTILSVKSQQFYFPKAAYTDTAKLRIAMSLLSPRVLQQLDKVKNKGMYELYVQTANQTIAGKYQDALNSINDLRDRVIKTGTIDTAASYGFLFIYEMYNQIRLMQEAGRGGALSVEDLFKYTFPIALENLNKEAVKYATEPFNLDPAAIEKEWRQQLESKRSKQTDSLSVSEANEFSRAYFQHWLYSRYVPLGKKVLATMDNTNYLIQDSTMITMRDGVKLAAVIVRNKKETSPQPVVMIANIYASTAEVRMAKEIADNGYTGIILNTRGKYVSDVSVEPFEHDANDIYDAIDWISKQTWNNGEVGMYGGSYLGFTQWAATKKLHPALKTIVPQVSAAPGIDFPMHNNIFSTYMLRWINNVTNSKFTEWGEFGNTSKWSSDFNKWYTGSRPFIALDSIEGRPNPVFQRWLKHPSYDAYWQNMIPYKEEFRNINIPVLTITGYFDGDQKGALYYYKEHNLWNPKANHYLLIGPYDHAGAQGSPGAVVNGYPIDPIAKIDITKLVFEWFDFVLKDSIKPQLLKDKVNYQVMDSNTWRHVPSIQHMNNGMLQYYLSASKSGNLFALSEQSSKESIPQQLEFISRKEQKIADEYKLLRDSLDTEGGIVFATETFENDFSINGMLTAELYASINKKDMDISMVLIEQRADGKCFTLSSSIQRASYSKDRSKRQLLKPGIKTSIPLTGSFISKKISKGSRLIFVIGLLKGPYLQVNYGTGKDVSVESIADVTDPLQVKWYGNSVIRIPVQKN